jgi:allophanate hydrolase
MTTTPTERVHAAFDRIDQVDRPEVWITLRSRDDVLADAAAVEKRLADGADLPLAGTVVAVKDNIDVAELPTTAACPEFAYTPTVTAPAIARLVEQGAVVLGKTNLDQFATGLVGTRSPYGPVRCAWDSERISGGSSSGSSVAVALGIADIGIGTDTAGSGRVPAAFHGIVGVKTTLGLIPTAGVVPACVDYDTVTVFAADLAIATRATRYMIGTHDDDPRSRPWPATVPLSASAAPAVAIPTSANLSALAPEYRDAFDRTVKSMVDKGFETVEVDIEPLLDAALLLYDGAIVAQRYAAVGDFVEKGAAGLDHTVSAIVRGAKNPAAHDYVDDLATLTAARRTAATLLADVDALVLPTTTEHPTIAAVQHDPIGINRRLGTFTNFCNLLDMAAVAVPGQETADGHPFGVMTVTPAFADQVALDVAARIVGADSADMLSDEGVDVLVVGAHLRGFPAAPQLTARRARFMGDVTTSDAYRLVDLHTDPPKPGLVRHEVGEGAPIAGEVYRMAAAHLGTFVAGLPAPMGLTQVELSDGRWVLGFCCSRDASERGTDITEFGGWRAYSAAHP